jgi:general secretion pathway protein L
MAILRFLLTDGLLTSNTLLEWAIFETTGTMRAQGNSTLAEMPRVESCEAIAPASQVLLTSVKLPVRQGEKARRLLPFAMEEQLAVEADTTHFALGMTLENGDTVVAVVDKNWLRDNLAVLTEHGFTPRHLYPEMLLPLLSDDAWTMVWQDQRGLVRTGLHSGFSLEGDIYAALLLATALRTHPPKQILLYADELPHWAAQLSVPVVLKSRWQWRQSVWQAIPLDILQGEFVGRQFHWKGGAKFKPLLGLVSAMLLVQLVGTGVDVWRMKREQQQLNSAMEASFRQAFPEATVVVDPVLQMERQRATLRRAAGIADANDFLSLLAKLTPSLLDTTPQKIHFENQQLSLELTVVNATALEALRTRINSTALKSEWRVDGLKIRLKVWEEMPSRGAKP